METVDHVGKLKIIQYEMYIQQKVMNLIYTITTQSPVQKQTKQAKNRMST